MTATTILKLRDSGFTDAQVSALAELVDAQAATKPDLDAVEQRLSPARSTALTSVKRAI